MCGRFEKGLLRPGLEPTELTLAHIQRALKPGTFNHLKRIYFCGNDGDPIIAQDLLPILVYLRTHAPHIRLNIHTNGGARPASWWKELAQVTDLVHFGVDGLEDTNEIYRQGVQWHRLEENLKSFIRAGGNAEVDFLVFAHNEEQVEAARARFAAMGVRQIRFKSTSRFFRFREEKWSSSKPIYDAKGAATGTLRPPIAEPWQSPVRQQYETIIEKHGSLGAYWDKTKIQCRVQQEANLYLSAEGLAFPCCWVAGEWPARSKSAFAGQIDELVKKVGADSLSIHKRSLQEIVDGEFFQKALPEGWESASLIDGKLKVCAKTCGQDFKPFEAQFQKTRAHNPATCST